MLSERRSLNSGLAPSTAIDLINESGSVNCSLLNIVNNKII